MARTPAVLIVDQDPEARFHVKRQLGQVPFEFMGDVGLGVEAVVRAAEARPDIVLCGLREPIARAHQTIESLVHALPQTPLIVYAESADLALVRRAMQAGARDFLRAPFTPDELSRSLAGALETEERRRLRETGAAVAGPHGRLITVFGAKGGVGKTSIATNLAVALTRRAGQSTVLVDLDDTFGDAAAALSVPAEATVTEAVRQLADAGGRKRGPATHASGLAVLAAPQSPLEWRGVTGDQVRALLRELTREFDAVVVDTASSLGDVSVAALQEAGRVLWVSTPEYASVRDSLQAFQAVRSLGAPQDRIGVVLNHTSSEIEVPPSSIEEALACPIFWSVPYDRRLRHAAQLGEALIDSDPASPAAASIADLALVLTGAAHAPIEKRRTLRSVLAGRIGGPRRPQWREGEALP